MTATACSAWDNSVVATVCVLSIAAPYSPDRIVVDRSIDPAPPGLISVSRPFISESNGSARIDTRRGVLSAAGLRPLARCTTHPSRATLSGLSKDRTTVLHQRERIPLQVVGELSRL